MAIWPYSTRDEISHLVCSDVPVLRARIDQLLDERRELKDTYGIEDDVVLPIDIHLTCAEERVVIEFARAGEGIILTKERLHKAHAGTSEPETELKMVDVIVCKLRKKLSALAQSLGDEGPIRTQWGRGYTMSPNLRAYLRGPISSRTRRAGAAV